MFLYPLYLRAVAIVCAFGIIWELIRLNRHGRLLRLTLLAALIGMFVLYTIPSTLYRLSSNGLRHQLDCAGGVDKLQSWAEGVLGSSEACGILIKATSDDDMATVLGMLPQEYRGFFGEFFPLHAVDNDLGEPWIMCAKRAHPDYTYGLLIGARASSPPSQYGYLVRLRDGVYVWHREF
jgi:hypothetical protein